MTKTRTIGTLAAIGGLTATIALLTGLPAASADELADLRANQELLQRRIDQLAQGALPETKVAPGIAGPLGTQPIPGQAIIGGSFPRSFLVPGTDTSIRVGGFVDLTANYFLQGANTANPGLPSSNFGQNGNLNGVPVGQMFVPGLGNVAQQANHSRGNGFFEFSPQQSRLNVETRTPTAWASCGHSLSSIGRVATLSASRPRSRPAATASSRASDLPTAHWAGFSPARRSRTFPMPTPIPNQWNLAARWARPAVRASRRCATPLRVHWAAPSRCRRNSRPSPSKPPAASLLMISNTGGLPAGPGTGNISATCNGVPCTGSGTPINGNIAKPIAPNLTVASYWAQPWGHVDFAGVLVPMQFNDGHFISRDYLGYGGHFSGDVKPGWFGWAKDDFLFSFVAGEGIGYYTSGGWANASAMSTNFTVATACATPQPGCTGGMAASNVIFSQNFAWSTNGGYQHWWTPNLRSTLAAGIAQQDLNSQLIGPAQASTFTKEQWNAFANLVWNPVAFITAGVQYNYGTRIVVANGKGHAQGFSAKFRVAF